MAASRRYRWIPAAAAAVALCGCDALLAPNPPARQWREGDIVHFDDGYAYHDAVNVALPHWHIHAGQYVQTDEPSTLHFHKSLNEHGPPNRFIKCWARLEDGAWRHSPQWYDEDDRMRRRGWGRD